MSKYIVKFIHLDLSKQSTSVTEFARHSYARAGTDEIG